MFVLYCSATDSVVVPLVDPDAAVTVVFPEAIHRYVPLSPIALVAVATVLSEVFQTKNFVRSRVVLSEKIPVAVNSISNPSIQIGLVGAISMLLKVAVVVLMVAGYNVLLETVSCPFMPKNRTEFEIPVPVDPIAVRIPLFGEMLSMRSSVISPDSKVA